MLAQNAVTPLSGAGTWVAVILTLVVFSYLLGDNVLYRLAEHIFVGVAVGYAVVVAFHSVIIPKLVSPTISALGAQNRSQLILLAITWLLGVLLFTKAFRRAGFLPWLGSFSLATLLGVGAALAISGALLGTLKPQIDATSDLSLYVGAQPYSPALAWFSGVLVLVATTGVLLHFYFGAGQRGRFADLWSELRRIWGGLGRWFILVTFAALLATTFMGRLSLLVGRVQFLIDSIRGFIGGLG
jgi:hypothetical protein